MSATASSFASRSGRDHRRREWRRRARNEHFAVVDQRGFRLRSPTKCARPNPRLLRRCPCSGCGRGEADSPDQANVLRILFVYISGSTITQAPQHIMIRPAGRVRAEQLGVQSLCPSSLMTNSMKCAKASSGCGAPLRHGDRVGIGDGAALGDRRSRRCSRRRRRISLRP